MTSRRGSGEVKVHHGIVFLHLNQFHFSNCLMRDCTREAFVAL